MCEYGWVKENSFQLITRPPEANSRERILTLEEVSKLLHACRSPYIYPVVLFALFTGTRRGEILNLKWENLQQNTTRFRHTKNGESHSVILPAHLLDILTSEKKRRITLSPYIFPSQDGKRPAESLQLGKRLLPALIS